MGKDVSSDQMLEFVNKVNDGYMVVRASTDQKDTFWFDMYLCVAGGTTRRNVVMAGRLFHDVLTGVLKEPFAHEIVA